MIPYTKPSFYALVATGIAVFIMLVLIIKSGNLDVNTLGLLGILIGTHGLLHLGMESEYNYNPLEQLSKSDNIF